MLTCQISSSPLPLPLSSGAISDWRMKVPNLYPFDPHSNSATPKITPAPVIITLNPNPISTDASSSKLAGSSQQPFIPQIASTSSLELVNPSDTDRGEGIMEVDGEDGEGKPKSTRKERRKEQNRAAQRVFRAKAKIQTQEVSQV
jgi:hypothetical protein